jgi:hypothetical protein
MFTRQVSFGLALVAGMMVAACAPTISQGVGDELYEQVAVGKTTLRVSNNSWADMNLFLLRGTTRHRLGMVTSMNTTTFTIPEEALSAASDLRLYADPIGSIRGWSTQPLLVNPGQEISLTLQNNLNLSSYSIF